MMIYESFYTPLLVSFLYLANSKTNGTNCPFALLSVKIVLKSLVVLVLWHFLIIRSNCLACGQVPVRKQSNCCSMCVCCIVFVRGYTRAKI